MGDMAMCLPRPSLEDIKVLDIVDRIADDIAGGLASSSKRLSAASAALGRTVSKRFSRTPQPEAEVEVQGPSQRFGLTTVISAAIGEEVEAEWAKIPPHLRPILTSKSATLTSEERGSSSDNTDPSASEMSDRPQGRAYGIKTVTEDTRSEYEVPIGEASDTTIHREPGGKAATYQGEDWDALPILSQPKRTPLPEKIPFKEKAQRVITEAFMTKEQLIKKHEQEAYQREMNQVHNPKVTYDSPKFDPLWLVALDRKYPPFAWVHDKYKHICTKRYHKKWDRRGKAQIVFLSDKPKAVVMDRNGQNLPGSGQHMGGFDEKDLELKNMRGQSSAPIDYSKRHYIGPSSTPIGSEDGNPGDRSLDDFKEDTLAEDGPKHGDDHLKVPMDGKMKGSASSEDDEQTLAPSSSEIDESGVEELDLDGHKDLRKLLRHINTFHVGPDATEEHTKAWLHDTNLSDFYGEPLIDSDNDPTGGLYSLIHSLNLEHAHAAEVEKFDTETNYAVSSSYSKLRASINRPRSQNPGQSLILWLLYSGWNIEEVLNLMIPLDDYYMFIDSSCWWDSYRIPQHTQMNRPIVDKILEIAKSHPRPWEQPLDKKGEPIPPQHVFLQKRTISRKITNLAMDCVENYFFWRLLGEQPHLGCKSGPMMRKGEY